MLRGTSLTHGTGIEKVAISRIDQGSFIEGTNRDGLSLLAVRGDEGKASRTGNLTNPISKIRPGASCAGVRKKMEGMTLADRLWSYH
jgi:hypothetical protein